MIFKRLLLDNPYKQVTQIINEEHKNGKNIILISDYYNDNETFNDVIDERDRLVEYHYGIPHPATIILLDILERNENIKSFIIFPYIYRSFLKDEYEGSRKLNYEKLKNQLDLFLNKFNNDIDLIAFCGIFDINDKTSYINIFNPNLFGRISLYNNKPSVHTLSLNHIGVDKSNENADNLASLIGFFIKHIDLLLYGKNRYTIDYNNIESILVDTIDKFKLMMDEIKKSPILCFDTETTGLSRTQDKLLTIQIAVSPKKAYIVPFQHKQSLFTSSEIEYIIKEFKDYFERGKSKYHIYQNAKFDLIQFFNHFKLKYYNHKIYDLMSGIYALDENQKNLMSVGIKGAYSLAFLTKIYGGGNIYEQGELGKEDRTTLENKDIKDIAEYGAKDVIIPYQISQFQIDEAKRLGDKHFLNVVTSLISDMIYCFVIMELNGEKLDKKYLFNLKSNSSPLVQMMNEAEEKIKQSENAQIVNDLLLNKAGFSTKPGICGIKNWLFRLNKEEHLQLLFFNILGLTPINIKKNGNGGIDAEFKKVYKDVPEVKIINDYEKYKKLKTAFVDAFFNRYKEDKDLIADNRLRSEYSFTKVITGRASSFNPNLQQIPSRGKDAKIIKREFITDSNCLLLKADYSAHEVRNWGNVAHDINIAKAFDYGKQVRKALRYYFSEEDNIFDKFREYQKKIKWVVEPDSQDKQISYDEKVKEINKITNKKFKKLCELMLDIETKGDVHRLNYQFFFGVPAALVTKEQRQAVKSIVFGVIYGKSARSLADDIQMSEEEAVHIMNKLFENFSNGKKWLDLVHESGKKTCLVESPAGRIRHLWAYKHPSYNIQSSMDRKGPNSCIQGFSSDIGFMSGKNMQDLCWNWFWKRGIDFKFKYMNVVHDSTETEVRIKHLPIALYMLEHSYTTLVHKKCKDKYNFDLTIGFEVEADIGGSFASMTTFTNYCEFKRIVTDSIKWCKDNLDDWSIEDNELEDCFYNYKIMNKYRKEELKMTNGQLVEDIMLLNEDNILNIGLRV